QTLEVLESHTKQIRWVRTDHNGLSTFTFVSHQTEIEVTRGELNDPVPNSADIVGPNISIAVARTPPIAAATLQNTISGVPSVFGTEPMTFTVPANATRVTVTIDLAPSARGQTSSGGKPAPIS